MKDFLAHVQRTLDNCCKFLVRKPSKRSRFFQLNLETLESRVNPHVDFAYGMFTPEEIEYYESIPFDSANSTKTPRPDGDGSHVTGQTLTIVLDFKSSAQGTTFDIFNNGVGAFDVTAFGFAANQFNLVTNSILAEVESDYFEELVGTVAGPEAFDLAIDFIIGDIGTPPPGVSEYYFVQIGSGVSGTHGSNPGILGVAGGSTVRRSNGSNGSIFGIEVGDVVGSIFTDHIRNLGGLTPSNALTSGNLGFTTFAVAGTTSHEIGHTLSLSHVNNAGSTQAVGGTSPIMGTGAIDLFNQARIQDRSFTLSGQDGENGNQSVAHVQQLVNAVGLHQFNVAPVVNNQTFGINENSTNNTLVGTVVATDANTGNTSSFNNTLTYSIQGGNTNGAFSINSTNGQIRVANSAALNFEALTQFQLTVQVADGLNASDTATITINVNDVNETPILDDDSFDLAEDSPNNFLVGTVQGTDPDNDNLTYTITAGNDDSIFSINASSGEIRVADNSLLDFETTPTYNLTVRATDDGTGNLFDTATVTINVLTANDPPTIDDQTFDIDENSPNNAIVGDIAATDPDVGDNLTYAILSGNEAGAFTLNTTTGRLTVANSSLLNFEDTTQFELVVRVTDTGNLQDTATITIDVNDLNEAPVAVDDTFSVAENSSLNTIVGTVTATDEDNGQTLSYAITSGNTGNAFSINPTTGLIRVATPPRLILKLLRFSIWK
ncbi:MAG: cadherin domain-containing protein [Zavarzinella sp.]